MTREFAERLASALFFTVLDGAETDAPWFKGRMLTAIARANNGLLPGTGFLLGFDESISADKVPIVVLTDGRDAGKARVG